MCYGGNDPWMVWLGYLGTRARVNSNDINLWTNLGILFAAWQHHLHKLDRSRVKVETLLFVWNYSEEFLVRCNSTTNYATTYLSTHRAELIWRSVSERSADLAVSWKTNRKPIGYSEYSIPRKPQDAPNKTENWLHKLQCGFITLDSKQIQRQTPTCQPRYVHKVLSPCCRTQAVSKTSWNR